MIAGAEHFGRTEGRNPPISRHFTQSLVVHRIRFPRYGEKDENGMTERNRPLTFSPSSKTRLHSLLRVKAKFFFFPRTFFLFGILALCLKTLPIPNTSLQQTFLAARPEKEYFKTRGRRKMNQTCQKEFLDSFKV